MHPRKKPACARKLAKTFPTEPKSLADDLKAARASKVQDSKNMAKLTSEQRKRLSDLKEKKQVGCYMMPDAPETKKGKGKGKKTSDTRNWIPCPLLPDVPAVPPPKKPQPWEVLRSQETIADAAGQSTKTVDSPNPVMERTAEDCDDDVIEGTPPEMTQIQPPVKKQKIDLSPSLGIIQVTESPANRVWADIEFLGFTPKASTSTTAPGSGTSTAGKTAHDDDDAHEIDMEMECELMETVASDSEVEADEEGNDDIILRKRNVTEYPAINEDIEDPNLNKQLQILNADDDACLRSLAAADAGDLLYFDWCGDVNYFEGTRETFTGPSGPTFETSGLTALQIFQKIWDTDIVNHIVCETNRYAHQIKDKTVGSVHSRMSRWKDVIATDIWRLFSIIMLQSLVKNDVEREYWYPLIDQLKIGNFDKIMSYNRFVLIKRCLHFVDNMAFPVKPSKLDKVMPIIEHLNKKFSSLYLPEQNVALDESLLLWKGRLSFAQLIATKRARVGIKSYELCESRTGYLWRMEVYSGKGHVHVPQTSRDEEIVGHDLDNEPDSATSQIVFNLMRPLFQRGHTLIMDNFYNAPVLSRLLKSKHGTDTMGTLRLNREFVPQSLKHKNKKNMKPGEVCFSSTKDLNVVVWKDKNVVAMITTFHRPEVGGKEKYGYYKYKPKVVLDYNLSMGGVDHKDQMLHAFPIERVRNICWYKKLFRRLLNVSIHNSLVIFNHGRDKRTELENRLFRLQLVVEILQKYSPEALNVKKIPVTLPQMHLPAKNPKAQRCKLCALAGVRRTTIWKCSTCNVNLCIDGCYTPYHAQYVCSQDL